MRAEEERKLIKRRATYEVRYGEFRIGDEQRITIESMLKCPTSDVAAALAQLRRLAQAGCDLCRVAVPTLGDAAYLPEMAAQSPIPLMADIHFRADLAEKALEAGMPVRLNPGNLSDVSAVTSIAQESHRRGLPLRIGVNAGSLSGKVLERHGGHVSVEGMVESLLELEEVCRSAGCAAIIASLKATSIPITLAANRLYAAQSQAPLHIGVTEAGFGEMGLVRSSVGIGTLLAEGIGDTIRVSLTGDPVPEVLAGRMILDSLGLGRVRVRLHSCPTCGRTRMPVEELARAIWEETRDWDCELDLAVMGCEVNGPGEAREADLGLAGTAEGGMLFREGKLMERISRDKLLEGFLAVARQLAEERSK